MSMTYDEAVAYVFGFANYEFTPLSSATAAALDLARLRSLLARLGDPQRSARTVHITGSKGKGSTAAMISALLRRSGARVGLYTSPHLHSPCERIAVDGEPVSESEFAALVTDLRPHVEAENAARGDQLTTFELLTAMAFFAFRERRCDWQVVEVGLGGRLDATNVLDEKDLCIFTPISLEHTAILGPTTAAIAADKAGILRSGTRAVMAPQDEQAAAVLCRACADMNAQLASIAGECAWSSTARGLDGQDAAVRTPEAEYRFFLPLLGGHQVENAATALRGIELLSGAGAQLTPTEAAEALATVRWPGRLEVLSRDPLVLADGAHNAASALRLAEALREVLPDVASPPAPLQQSRTGETHEASSLSPAGEGWGEGEAQDWRNSQEPPTAGRPHGRLVLVLGTLTDKDLAGMVAALAPVTSEVTAVQPDMPRARPAEEVAAAFAAAGVPAGTGASVAAGLRAAINRAGPHGAVCVAGSLYTVAEARAELLGVGNSGQRS
jgi:dihydrofolate synthase/folylpolyglutamate synthase